MSGAFVDVSCGLGLLYGWHVVLALLNVTYSVYPTEKLQGVLKW